MTSVEYKEVIAAIQIGWWGAMGAPKHKGITQYGGYRSPLVRGLKILKHIFIHSLYNILYHTSTFSFVVLFCFLHPLPTERNIRHVQRSLLRLTAMSPYRQSPFRGVFSGYLFHGARRLASNAPFFVPPFAAGTTVFFLAMH